MARRSPTARTLELLRYLVDEEDIGKVELWIPGANKRKDLWGLYDYAVLWTVPSGHARTLGIQITSGNHHAGHRSKMRANPKLATSISARWIPLLITWTKAARKDAQLYRARIELLMHPDILPTEFQDIVQLLEQFAKEVIT